MKSFFANDGGFSEKEIEDAFEFAKKQALERGGYWRTNERGAMRLGLDRYADDVVGTRYGNLYIGGYWRVELICG